MDLVIGSKKWLNDMPYMAFASAFNGILWQFLAVSSAFMAINS